MAESKFDAADATWKAPSGTQWVFAAIYAEKRDWRWLWLRKREVIMGWVDLDDV